jgi:hypothetical protein
MKKFIFDRLFFLNYVEVYFEEQGTRIELTVLVTLSRSERCATQLP